MWQKQKGQFRWQRQQIQFTEKYHSVNNMRFVILIECIERVTS